MGVLGCGYVDVWVCGCVGVGGCVGIGVDLGVCVMLLCVVMCCSKFEYYNSYLPRACVCVCVRDEGVYASTLEMEEACNFCNAPQHTTAKCWIL